MKKLFTLFFCLLTASMMFAQICEPDDTYADTTGVFPPPYHDTECPDCGITDTACIGMDFYFRFTVAVGETIEIVPGFPQALDSVVVDEITYELNGNSVNLEGISVECNPSNCTYPANFLGCAALTGIPTAANQPGDYDLVIHSRVFVGGSPQPIPITFPNAFIAPGNYTLTVAENGNPNCLVGTDDILETQIELKSIPNPTTGLTQIQVSSQIADDVTLNVTDLYGKNVYSEKIKINEGDNYFEFDGTNLPSGIYIYSVGNDLGVVSKKLIISRR